MQPILILSAGGEESDEYARLLGLTLGEAGMDWRVADALPQPPAASLCLPDAAHPDLPAIRLACGDAGIPCLTWGWGEESPGHIARPVLLSALPGRCRALIGDPQPEGTQTVLPGREAPPALRVSEEEGAAFFGEERLTLTATEFSLLSLLFSRRGSPVSRKEIAEAVLGHPEKGNEVDVYVRAVRRRLEEKTDRRLIASVRGVGYLLRTEEK